MRIIIVLTNKFLKDKLLSLRAVVQLGLTIILSTLIVVVCLRLYFHYFYGFSISQTQQWIFIIIFIVTTLLYNILYFSNYYLQKENTLKLNAEKQQRQVLELEMNEFKNDINPDLLYESLESLLALMYRDTAQAEDYIDCLAGTYRYILTNRNLELVTVHDEIGAAQNLVKLLNEKYQGQIKFTSSIKASEFNTMLIPGSLPIVIESLVRNTIFTKFEPLIIQCYLEDEYVTIQSKLNERLILHEASSGAMARLQKSYSLYSDLPLISVKAYDENYIKLPVIRIAEEVEHSA
jgi:hypothetical protein